MSTYKQRVTAFNKFINKDEFRPNLLKAWNENDFQSACNGFIAIRLKEEDKLTGIEMFDESEREFLNIKQVFDTSNRDFIFIGNCKTLSLKCNEFLADLKLKKQKSEDAFFQLFNSNTYVDAGYLKTALIALNDKPENITIKIDIKCRMPIFLYNKNGSMAVVMPLRLNEIQGENDREMFE